MRSKFNKNKMNTNFWDEKRGRIRSSKGGWIIGEAVYNHGYSIMDDLVGKASFFQVLVLNVTGRMPDPSLGKWLDALFICFSWPDSRIWCNQVGALAATMRTSPTAGISAGILASDSRMYGPGALLPGIKFISEALSKKKKGKTAGEIIEEHPKRNEKGSPVIMGFAHPIVNGDDRVFAMRNVAISLGFQQGEHERLAFEIESLMKIKYHEGMNLLGYMVSFLCDQGFSSNEIRTMLGALVNSGIHACFEESYSQPPESFFPLRCEDIDYQGKPPRPLL